MKKCSPSLAIKKMQIKKKLRFCLTPVNMGSITSITQTMTNAGEDVGKKKHSHTVGGNVN
jgi:hypothetical protein